MREARASPHTAAHRSAISFFVKSLFHGAQASKLLFVDYCHILVLCNI